MKNLLFNLVLSISFGILTYAQEPTYQEIPCNSKEVTFYDNPDFLYNSKYFTTIPKRSGVNSYKDLSENEIKELKREAKKYKCCIIVCDFDYQTPYALEDYDLVKEKQKEKNFYFYIAKKVEEVDTQKD